MKSLILILLLLTSCKTLKQPKTSAMTPNLTDFSYGELQYLYLVLEDKARELQDKIDTVEHVFTSGTIKKDLIVPLTNAKEINNQWMTKVLEASLTVKMHDIINSN
jgi:hypothetical protein